MRVATRLGGNGASRDSREVWGQRDAMNGFEIPKRWSQNLQACLQTAGTEDPAENLCMAGTENPKELKS